MKPIFLISWTAVFCNMHSHFGLIVFINVYSHHFRTSIGMRILANMVWLLFGGIVIAIEYTISSILLMITIVGIPFGMQTLKLAGLALWPFGKRVVTHDRSNGCIYIFFNVFWILVGGIWIALSHFIFGLLFYITIIGIPFGKQHMKLAALSLNPFGKDIVGRNDQVRRAYPSN